MSNENLKHALTAAGLTVERFAEIIEVDPKTVQRWVAGATVPYQRNQATRRPSARLQAQDLWPEPDSEFRADQVAAVGVGDVTGSWGASTDPGAPAVRSFITDATTIDLLDIDGSITSRDGLVQTLIDRARAGAQVRVLTCSVGDQLRPLVGIPGIEICWTQVPLTHSLVIADQQMLVRFWLADSGLGDPDADPTVLLVRLRRNQPGGLYDQLAAHYEQCWADPEEIITSTSELDDDLIDDHGTDGHQSQRPVGTAPPPAQPDPPRPDTPAPRPVRRWPRRPD